MIMASYNKFENNIFRDTMVVCIGNCVSSVFAGFGVFSFLGHMAYRNCLEVKDVVKSGPGLGRFQTHQIRRLFWIKRKVNNHDRILMLSARP